MGYIPEAQISSKSVVGIVGLSGSYQEEHYRTDVTQ